MLVVDMKEEEERYCDMLSEEEGEGEAAPGLSLSSGQAKYSSSKPESAAGDEGTTGDHKKMIPWTKQEDAELRQLVEEHGAKNWHLIAADIPGRAPKSCRLRWINHLAEGLRTGPFTPEEDAVVLEAQARLGNKWTLISKMLPGRSDNSVKNRWNSALRKRVEGATPPAHHSQASAQHKAAGHNRHIHHRHQPTPEPDGIASIVNPPRPYVGLDSAYILDGMGLVLPDFMPYDSVQACMDIEKGKQPSSNGGMGGMPAYLQQALTASMQLGAMQQMMRGNGTSGGGGSTASPPSSMPTVASTMPLHLPFMTLRPQMTPAEAAAALAAESDPDKKGGIPSPYMALQRTPTTTAVASTAQVAGTSPPVMLGLSGMRSTNTPPATSSMHAHHIPSGFMPLGAMGGPAGCITKPPSEQAGSAPINGCMLPTWGLPPEQAANTAAGGSLSRTPAPTMEDSMLGFRMRSHGELMKAAGSSTSALCDMLTSETRSPIDLAGDLYLALGPCNDGGGVEPPAKRQRTEPPRGYDAQVAAEPGATAELAASQNNMEEGGQVADGKAAERAERELEELKTGDDAAGGGNMEATQTPGEAGREELGQAGDTNAAKGTPVDASEAGEAEDHPQQQQHMEHPGVLHMADPPYMLNAGLDSILSWPSQGSLASAIFTASSAAFDIANAFDQVNIAQLSQGEYNIPAGPMLMSPPTSTCDPVHVPPGNPWSSSFQMDRPHPRTIAILGMDQGDLDQGTEEAAHGDIINNNNSNRGDGGGKNLEAQVLLPSEDGTADMLALMQRLHNQGRISGECLDLLMKGGDEALSLLLTLGTRTLMVAYSQRGSGGANGAVSAGLTQAMATAAAETIVGLGGPPTPQGGGGGACAEAGLEADGHMPPSEAGLELVSDRIKGSGMLTGSGLLKDFLPSDMLDIQEWLDATGLLEEKRGA